MLFIFRWSTSMSTSSESFWVIFSTINPFFLNSTRFTPTARSCLFVTLNADRAENFPARTEATSVLLVIVPLERLPLRTVVFEDVALTKGAFETVTLTFETFKEDDEGIVVGVVELNGIVDVVDVEDTFEGVAFV